MTYLPKYLNQNIPDAVKTEAQSLSPESRGHLKALFESPGFYLLIGMFKKREQQLKDNLMLMTPYSEMVHGDSVGQIAIMHYITEGIKNELDEIDTTLIEV